MVTYADLRAAAPDEWTAIAVAYRSLAAAIADSADALAAALDRIQGSWSGEVADQAYGSVAQQRGALYAAYAGLVAIDEAVSEFAGKLADAQSAAIHAAAQGTGSAIEVSPDGVVSLLPAGGPPDAQDVAELQAARSAIDAAVAAADTADGRLAGDLDGAYFGSGTPPAIPVPAAGTDPIVVALWWQGLPTAQQRYLVLTSPQLVMSLDGVPVDARDRAGRLVLHQQMVSILHEQLGLAGGILSPTTNAKLRTLSAEVGGLQAIAKRLDDTGEERAYLLDLDPQHGEVIIAVNNPDVADHTLTFVPGTGSSLAKASALVTTIDDIETATGDVPASNGDAPGSAGSAATIGWLDYPAPANIAQAATISRASTGAPALDQFLDGLRHTHETPDGQESVLGYSYGSVVTGAAAARYGGLDTDDVILVGSPGAVVDQAGGFGVPPGHVWATLGAGDAILLARDFSDPSRLFQTGRLRFGINPVTPQFGASVFTSASGSNPIDTHLSYFNPGTPSLANIAKIAMGDYADVT